MNGDVPPVMLTLAVPLHNPLQVTLDVTLAVAVPPDRLLTVAPDVEVHPLLSVTVIL